MIDYNLNLWKDFLDEDAQNEYKNAGYYSQNLKLRDGTVLDKVRVLGVNSQSCYNSNFAMWSERNDPGD
jgi:hypothetical protein